MSAPVECRAAWPVRTVPVRLQTQRQGRCSELQLRRVRLEFTEQLFQQFE